MVGSNAYSFDELKMLSHLAKVAVSRSGEAQLIPRRKVQGMGTPKRGAPERKGLLGIGHQRPRHPDLRRLRLSGGGGAQGGGVAQGLSWMWVTTFGGVDG